MWQSACIAGDPGSIPGSGWCPREGIGYTLQCSWASLVAQLVKNQPAMWETWVRPLGWEDPLEKGKATHSSILSQRLWWTVQSMGSQRVRHDWASLSSFFLSLSPWQFCVSLFWGTWAHSSWCIQNEFLRNTKVPISTLKAWGWWDALKNKQGPVLPLGNYVTFTKFLNYIWSLRSFIC